MGNLLLTAGWVINVCASLETTGLPTLIKLMPELG